MQNTAGISGYADDAHCRSCISPLARITTRIRGASERRAVKRVALQDEIPFYTSWPQSAPFKGRLVDLSPLGMQFVTDQALQPNQMIKLEGRGLSAVARVVRCSRRANHRGDHLVGVQFATLAIKTRRASA
jgi:c-di-GMP-binding flagellar brake protein YcgR